MEKDAQSIIIIKKKKGHGHGHHGGGWKVAFADFMTAMMAFFLLMWVIESTTPAEKEAIAGYMVEGVATTLPFGQFVLDHPAFISADFTTHFVQQYFSAEQLIESQKPAASIAAHLALRLYLEQQEQLQVANVAPSNWRQRAKS